jgi:ribosomal 50S subunit-recycling heat shock protein
MRAVVESVRVDKWLWAARFFKTRRAATEAVVGGRARVNGERVKASKEIRPADVVDVRVGDARWTVKVTSLAERRGPQRLRRPSTRKLLSLPPGGSDWLMNADLRDPMVLSRGRGPRSGRVGGSRHSADRDPEPGPCATSPRSRTAEAAHGRANRASADHIGRSRADQVARRVAAPIGWCVYSSPTAVTV